MSSWPFEDKVVWDPAVHKDVSVLGRYTLMARAKHDLCYVQDDDCLVPIDELLDAYTGRALLNIPPDEGPLVGWGALIDRREAHSALCRYLAVFPRDETFMRCADFVVTALIPWDRVDLGHEDLPWATAPDRMYHRPTHYEEQEVVKQRCGTL
jgi:hypothetical protein